MKFLATPLDDESKSDSKSKSKSKFNNNNNNKANSRQRRRARQYGNETTFAAISERHVRRVIVGSQLMSFVTFDELATDVLGRGS